MHICFEIYYENLCVRRAQLNILIDEQIHILPESLLQTVEQVQLFGAKHKFLVLKKIFLTNFPTYFFAKKLTFLTRMGRAQSPGGSSNGELISAYTGR